MKVSLISTHRIIRYTLFYYYVAIRSLTDVERQCAIHEFSNAWKIINIREFSFKARNIIFSQNALAAEGFCTRPPDKFQSTEKLNLFPHINYFMHCFSI